MDYTADAKNGFNAIVKTHGPNTHPFPDGDNERHDTEHLQSKINHYSREQDTIILSSDLPYDEPAIANIKDKRQPIPSLLELKPFTELKKPKVSYNNEDFRPSVRIQEVNPPDLSRNRDRYQYTDVKKNDLTRIIHPSHHQAAYNTKPIYGVRHTDPIASKMRPVANKQPLQTPGLRHYATPHQHQKRIALPRNSIVQMRPDYNSYFRKPAQSQHGVTKSFASEIDEQAQASWRLIQNMLKRNRVGLAATYASRNTDYFI